GYPAAGPAAARLLAAGPPGGAVGTGARAAGRGSPGAARPPDAGAPGAGKAPPVRPDRALLRRRHLRPAPGRLCADPVRLSPAAASLQRAPGLPVLPRQGALAPRPRRLLSLSRARLPVAGSGLRAFAGGGHPGGGGQAAAPPLPRRGLALVPGHPGS